MKITDYLFLVLGPMVFLIFLVVGTPATFTPEMWKVMAVAAWMVTWWVTEAVPLPVTALLPMVLFPWLGIFDVEAATAPYADPVIFLFMGGFLMALALEKHHLHKRIALNLIRMTGTSGNRIIMGFMMATAFLSMWISNTATAVMMLPVAISVVTLIGGKDPEQLNASGRKFSVALMLSVAYAASIGGMMTLIGTPPNVIMAGYLRQMTNYEISFSSWLSIGIPVGILLLILCYLLLTRFLFRSDLLEIEGSRELIRKDLGELGPMSAKEKVVMALFMLMAFGWIFKGQINELLEVKLLSDTTIAMAGGILLFIIPENAHKKQFLLQWDDIKRIPWGILILFGGGLCLGGALQETGIIQLIADSTQDLKALDIFTITLIIIIIVIYVTELMSNTALAAVFIPLLIGIAEGSAIHPLLLVIPATLASSCAFMMPVATPPNAVVFASGYIRMKDMIKAGFWLNLVCVGILSLVTVWLVQLFFM